MDIKTDIGNRITSARKTLGITIKELSARTKGALSAARISNWEQGTRSPGPLEAKTLSSILNVSASYLLCLSDDTRGDILLHADTLPRYAPILPINETHLSKAKLKKLIQATEQLPNDINKISLEQKTRDNAGKNTFATILEDTSMSPNFLPNDILIIDPDKIPRPGQYVLAHIKSTKTNVIRKYKEANTKKGSFELIAINDDWGSTQINSSKDGEIIGTAIECRGYF